ncbi:MAG: acyltransferase [Faecalibacterium sp.]|jgi:fucose 4-O-acetylase-like acetyltransferase|nr:acyltransferase [Faecalibacterium sp.]
MSISENNRAAWLDTARGLAILLVVAGHMCEGFFTQGTVFGDVTRMHQGWDIIYSFHMPLMFMASGCAAALSLHTRKRAWLHDALALYVPYVFFSLFYLFGKTFLFHSAQPVPMSRWLLFWVYPVGIFWFLPALLVIRIVHRWLWEKLGAWALAVWAACAVLGCFIPWPDPLLLVQDILCYGICYGIGYFYLRAENAPRARLLLSCSAGLMLVCSIFLSGSISAFPRRLTIGLCFSIAILQLLRTFALRLPVLSCLGRHSLPIYLLHSFMTGPLFAVLAHFTHSIPLVLIAGIVLEIAVPLACEQIWLRVPFLRWAEFFVYPAKVLGRSKHASPPEDAAAKQPANV